MRVNQMSDSERETYTRFVKETKPALKRHQYKVVIASIVVFLVVLGVIVWYWVRPTVSISTSLSVGGQLYAFWGALLLVLGALSSPSTLGLMSMTRWDGNSKLFAELMKSRFTAIVGVYFIVIGFSIQAAVTLALGS